MKINGNSTLNPAMQQNHAAREIMGNNFFGVEEAAKYLNVHPNKYDLAQLAEVPFEAETLERLKDTHILVAFFPFSILEVRFRVDPNLFYSHNNAWYNRHDFAKYTHNQVLWYLIRKNPVPDSLSKTWQEQQRLVTQDEMVSTAQITTYAIITYYLATGERLFEDTNVRCADMISFDHRPTIYFPPGGLSILRNYLENQRYDNVGLITNQRPDILKI